MTFPLPTDTRHVSIEGRQYRLFNKVDLGEGIPRTTALIVVLITIPWIVLMASLGVGISGTKLVFYLLPPAVLSFMALRKDGGGRPSYAKWLDYVRWRMRRHQQLIPLPGGSDGKNRSFVASGQWVVLDADTIKPRRTLKKEFKADATSP